MGWFRAEAMNTRSSLPFLSTVMTGAADTSCTSTLLPIMAGTAAAVAMCGISTVTPYFSKAPMALAIHSGANDPAVAPQETTSLGVPAFAEAEAGEAAGAPLAEAGFDEAATDALAAAEEADAAALVEAGAALDAAGAALDDAGAAADPPPQACSSPPRPTTPKTMPETRRKSRRDRRVTSIIFAPSEEMTSPRLSFARPGQVPDCCTYHGLAASP